MGNAYTGEEHLDLGKKKVTIVFDWRAISELKTRHRNSILKTMLDDPDPEIIASILQVGLMKYHPEITTDEIIAASPAIYPTLASLDAALAHAYFGPRGAEESKKNPPAPPKKRGILTKLLRR